MCLAERHCTDSSLWTLEAVRGSQMIPTYSKITADVQARCLVLCRLFGDCGCVSNTYYDGFDNVGDVHGLVFLWVELHEPV